MGPILEPGQEKWRQDARTPGPQGQNTFLDIGESRFRWQKPVSDVDAFYNLPDTLGKIATPFGSSTRTDWEGTVKNKRDGVNPYAGPGNYNTNNFTVLSTCRAAPNNKFGFSARAASYETSSPGPTYDIAGIYRNGTDRRVGVGFNKDDRKPMLYQATDATYYPKLAKAPSVKIGTKLKTGSAWGSSTARSPGPIYNVGKYDFRTGPRFSFGGSKSDRFKGGCM